MRKTLVLAGALLLAWTLPGLAAENESADKVVKDMINFFNDATKELKTVKDQKSAEAAKPKLEELAKKGQDLQMRLRKLNLSREQMMDLQKKYKDQLQTAQKDFRQEMMRVQNVEGGKTALAALMGQRPPSGQKKESNKPVEKQK